jgi:hypothetical protein
MGSVKRSSSTLFLTGGCLLGATVLFLIALLVSHSISTAVIFSVIPVGFFAPVVIVFAVAAAHPAYSGKCSDGEPRQSDIAIAVGYTAAVIPYWFGAISAINGRIGLSLALFAAYAAIAAFPLQRMLRARKAIEGGAMSRREKEG